MTTNPIPPKTINKIIMPFIGRLVEKLSKLLENVEKPALQKAEIAWNADIKSRCSCIPTLLNEKYKRTVPIVSIMTAVITIFLIITDGFVPNSLINISLMIELLTIENFLTGVARKNAKKVTNPRPPASISNKITIFPNIENCAVSTTIRPVTQTALVAVNKESKKESFWAPCHETGNSKSEVPKIISSKK